MLLDRFQTILIKIVINEILYFSISAGILLYFLHSLFLSSDYSSQTNISLKAIYLFNLFSVIFVCSVLKLNSRIKNPANPLGLFVFTTIIKMATAIIILFPVFNLEKENLFIDLMNFFAVYFVFQIAEVVGIKDVLK